MAVISAAFLVAVGLALTRIHVEYDGARLTPLVHRVTLSVHPRRTNREYPERLRGALVKDRTPRMVRAGVVERRLRVETGPSGGAGR
jgi:hypothetical protein